MERLRIRLIKFSPSRRAVSIEDGERDFYDFWHAYICGRTPRLKSLAIPSCNGPEQNYNNDEEEERKKKEEEREKKKKKREEDSSLTSTFRQPHKVISGRMKKRNMDDDDKQ